MCHCKNEGWENYISQNILETPMSMRDLYNLLNEGCYNFAQPLCGSADHQLLVESRQPFDVRVSVSCQRLSWLGWCKSKWGVKSPDERWGMWLSSVPVARHPILPWHHLSRDATMVMGKKLPWQTWMIGCGKISFHSLDNVYTHTRSEFLKSWAYILV